MTDTLLSIRNLKTCFDTSQGIVNAVDDISFDIKRGETFALLGESGCGKSVTSLSMMRLVPTPAGRIVSGSIELDGQDLLKIPEVAMRKVRGNRMAMIFQEPMTSLNPVLSIGHQIGETVTQHQKLTGRAMKDRVLDLIDSVGIADPAQRYKEYPHQLSGGMKQRVMIAIALAGEPELLIADEPTTALDVTIQAQVLELLAKLQQDTGMAILLITHDLGVVSEMADTVAVMYAGHIVEQAPREQFFADPKHPYSQKLFESLPDIKKREHRLAVIEGAVPSLSQKFQGCRFAERCEFAWQACQQTDISWTRLTDTRGVRCLLHEQKYASQKPDKVVKKTQQQKLVRRSQSNDRLLTTKDLKVHFPIQKGLFKRTVGHVYAVDGVSLTINPGQTLALVGESGCGKTTVGKAILQLIRPTEGSVLFENDELTKLSGEVLRKRRADFQIIFQDPFSSMNPRMMVADIIQEGMLALGVETNKISRERRVDELLEQVGLPPETKHRYPHEFSGGQRQRICIARALAVNPKLIICDEPTSALDISVQAQILNLLKGLQNDMGLSYLFITHNLSVVAYLADEVAVMYLGRIVEHGPVKDVLKNPQHPYTKALLSAIPVIEDKTKRAVIRLEGDMPSPVNPPSGCHFHTRCPEVMPVCKERYPGSTAISESHSTRCFLYGDN